MQILNLFNQKRPDKNKIPIKPLKIHYRTIAISSNEKSSFLVIQRTIIKGIRFYSITTTSVASVERSFSGRLVVIDGSSSSWD